MTIIGMFEAIDTIVLGIDTDEMVRQNCKDPAHAAALIFVGPRSPGRGGAEEATNKHTYTPASARRRRYS